MKNQRKQTKMKICPQKRLSTGEQKTQNHMDTRQDVSRCVNIRMCSDELAASYDYTSKKNKNSIQKGNKPRTPNMMCQDLCEGKQKVTWCYLKGKRR